MTDQRNAAQPVWIIVNRDTGIVVSRWLTESDAERDRASLDAKWRDVEPASKLEVRLAN